MIRLFAIVALLSACPARDIAVMSTPMKIADYGAYGHDCQKPTREEISQLGKTWRAVVDEGINSGFIKHLERDYTVRVCFVAAPFKCGTIDAIGCAGSNAIILSRVDAIRALMVNETINHLVASGQTVIPFEAPEFGPGGILQDARYKSITAAVFKRLGIR